MSTLISKNDHLVSQKTSIIKPGVELIGIINKRGKMTESIGSGSFGMPNSKKEMFLMKIALRTAMQKDFDEDLGEVNYCMTQRGNRKYISIPVPNNNTVLAVTKKDFDPEELVKNIIKMLKNSEQFLGEALFPKEIKI